MPKNDPYAPTSPVQPSASHPATVQAPNRHLGFCERISRNDPQAHSAYGGVFAFLIAGMNTAWAVGFRSFTFFPVTRNIECAFYIGCIIGAVLGGGLCNRVKRKYLLMISSALIFMDGIILLAGSRNYNAIMAAKYFDGIAVGLIVAPTLTLIGEESVKSIRGFLASFTDVMYFYLGVLTQICICSLWSWSQSMIFNVLQLQGIMNVIMGLISPLIIYFLFVESPVHHLKRGQEQMAIDAVRRLQRPFVITTETYEILAEHKRYVSTNKELSYMESFVRGLPAVGVLAVFRSLVALGFCTQTYTAISLLTQYSGGDWHVLVYLFGFLLVVGAIIPAFMMDFVGRRKTTLIGVIMCGIMALAFAINFDNLRTLSSSWRSNTMICLIGIYAFFASFSTISSSVYLSEAFPLAAKPVHISITFIVQMIVQIIVTCFFRSSIAGFFYVKMAYSFLFVALAMRFLPETKGLSLQDAQAKFNYVPVRSSSLKEQAGDAVQSFICDQRGDP